MLHWVIGSPNVKLRFTHRAANQRAVQCTRRGAFSLVELMVVMAVAIMLTGLLMPAMRQLHENAHRVMCLSNLQQIGHGFVMYGNEHNDFLPYSATLQVDQAPQNLMSAWRPGREAHFDGIGALFDLHYCDSPQCFYCPSHEGNHPYERYAELWNNPCAETAIFTNYHYAGDVDWITGKRRRLTDGHSLVLATDGLRCATDFNHVTGMNVLRGDISVRWRDDTQNILGHLPQEGTNAHIAGYDHLWSIVEQQR